MTCDTAGLLWGSPLPQRLSSCAAPLSQHCPESRGETGPSKACRRALKEDWSPEAMLSSLCRQAAS